MAIKSGIFNSVNGDRRYKAEDFAKYFSTFISNGVFPNPSNGFQVIENRNMVVTIKAGQAWINGYYVTNDADYNLTIDVADGVLNRIDRVVLQLNFLNREIVPIVKKGAFASSPVAPALKRDADAYEIALADVYVGKGVLSITQANITDLRLNTELCGIVHGLVDQVDTTSIFNQYQSWYQSFTANKQTEIAGWQTAQEQEFNNWQAQEKSDFDTWKEQEQADFDVWFQSIQGILDGDVAANLANRISTLEQSFNAHKADDVNHVKYAVATGTANTYVITLNPAPTDYVEGMAVSVKINVDSDAASTLNINGLGAKGIKKANGTDATNLKANGIYTMRYDGSNFILQGEGGSGNATASDLLSGKTASTDAGDIVGTMPNRGTFNIPLGASVPAGYYSGGSVPSGKRSTSGSKMSTGNNLTVTGLSFQPSKVTVTFTLFSSNYHAGAIKVSSTIYNFYGVVGSAMSISTTGATFNSDGFTIFLSTNNNNVLCSWEATE